MNTLTTRRAYRTARRRRSILTAALSGAVATAIAVVLAVAGSGATFAILSSNTVAMPSTAITAGTATVDVTSPAAFTLLTPGVVQGRSVTVTNTGNAALGLTVESATFSGTLAASTNVALLSGAVTCDGASGTAVWTRTPATTPTGPIAITLAAGASTTLCLTMTVAPDAPATAANSSMNASITLGGKQP
jgi:hypothetical protein